jgi:hypothetical protein
MYRIYGIGTLEALHLVGVLHVTLHVQIGYENLASPYITFLLQYRFELSRCSL